MLQLLLLGARGGSHEIRPLQHARRYRQGHTSAPIDDVRPAARHSREDVPRRQSDQSLRLLLIVLLLQLLLLVGLGVRARLGARRRDRCATATDRPALSAVAAPASRTGVAATAAAATTAAARCGHDKRWPPGGGTHARPSDDVDSSAVSARGVRVRVRMRVRLKMSVCVRGRVGRSAHGDVPTHKHRCGVGRAPIRNEARAGPPSAAASAHATGAPRGELARVQARGGRAAGPTREVHRAVPSICATAAASPTTDAAPASTTGGLALMLLLLLSKLALVLRTALVGSAALALIAPSNVLLLVLLLGALPVAPPRLHGRARVGGLSARSPV